MRTPTEHEIQQLLHKSDYDPVARREYYLRNRKLKGRKKGRGDEKVVYEDGSVGTRAEAAKKKTWVDPKTGKTAHEIQREKFTKELKGLEDRLSKLEDLIKKRMREEASEDRKGKAKKERAAKERDKPKTAAEKAEAARENKKYRDKNQQKLKSDAKKDDKSSGGESSKGKGSGAKKKHSVDELKSLAKKVRGQIAVAKQKLAAL